MKRIITFIAEVIVIMSIECIVGRLIFGEWMFPNDAINRLSNPTSRVAFVMLPIVLMLGIWMAYTAKKEQKGEQ